MRCGSKTIQNMTANQRDLSALLFVLRVRALGLFSSQLWVSWRVLWNINTATRYPKKEKTLFHRVMGESHLVRADYCCDCWVCYWKLSLAAWITAMCQDCCSRIDLFCWFRELIGDSWENLSSAWLVCWIVARWQRSKVPELSWIGSPLWSRSYRLN